MAYPSDVPDPGGALGPPRRPPPGVVAVEPAAAGPPPDLALIVDPSPPQPSVRQPGLLSLALRLVFGVGLGVLGLVLGLSPFPSGSTAGLVLGTAGALTGAALAIVLLRAVDRFQIARGHRRA
jgi:hypothetical protein